MAAQSRVPGRVPPSSRDGKESVVTAQTGDMVPVVYQQLAKDVFSMSVAWRFVNALLIATFFQPDEYFQALEPAWKIAFGEESGAWITWEWTHQLRSSLHPVLFAAVYALPENAMKLLSFFPQFRAMILVYLPRIVQGMFAATGDYYTWKFAERIYGVGSYTAWTALLLSWASPWQWFCSTRTLSNSLEMVLTIVALNYWPWALGGDVDGKRTISAPVAAEVTAVRGVFRTTADMKSLRICLILAGFACILRPTNLLVWAPLVVVCITRTGLTGRTRATSDDFFILLREAVWCGAVVLTLSGISDSLYYGEWTFPAYHWLNFNITKSLAIFYGTNDWHYYFSQGLPLLLTTYLPFALAALWSSSSLSSTSLPSHISNIRFQLTFVVLVMVTTLSRISHKEVRFIYPLLPALHILTAPHVLSFFNATPLNPTILNSSSNAKINIKGWRNHLLIALLFMNICIAGYATQVHQRGVIDVITFIRSEYEATRLTKRGALTPTGQYDEFPETYADWGSDETFVGFLMPCHSTPWRSHLIYPSLRAWALTCEPPLDIPADTPERAAYRDEADRFYDDPMAFLKSETNTKEKPWPRYIVGFEGIESHLQNFYDQTLPGFEVRRKWEGFNSHWHDDWRRKGKVVVWEFVDSSQPQGEIEK